MLVSGVDDVLNTLQKFKEDSSTRYIGFGSVKGSIFGNDIKKLFVNLQHNKQVVFPDSTSKSPQNERGGSSNYSLRNMLECVWEGCSIFSVFKNFRLASLDHKDALVSRTFSCDDLSLNEYHELVYQTSDGYGSSQLCTVLVNISKYSSCNWYITYMAQFETYGVHREVPNTTEKTKIKWAREGLNTDRWQMRKSLADRAITDRPDLFQRRIASNADEANILSPSSARLCQKHHAKRDIIFGIYNYEEATSLYRWMRSLREAGAPCDVVVFTHRAHDKLKKVCK